MPNPVEHQLRWQRENVIEFKVRGVRPLSLSLPCFTCASLSNCFTCIAFTFYSFSVILLFLSLFFLTQSLTASSRQIFIYFLILLPLSLCLLLTSILVCFPFALLTIFAQFMAQIITILWHCYSCYKNLYLLWFFAFAICLLLPSFASICNYH